MTLYNLQNSKSVFFYVNSYDFVCVFHTRTFKILKYQKKVKKVILEHNALIFIFYYIYLLL